MGLQGRIQDSPKGGVGPAIRNAGGGGGGVRFRSDTKSVGGGEGGGVAVHFRPDTKSGEGGGGVLPASGPIQQAGGRRGVLSTY